MSFKRKPPLKIIITLLLLSLSTYAGAKQKPEDSSWSKIKAGKEILLARNVINALPIWCGPGSALIYTYEEGGFVIHDLDTGKKLKFSDPKTSPVACTPDGKWLIYADRRTYRPVNDDPNHDVLIDLWRYEFATEKKERFIVVGGEEHDLNMQKLQTGEYRLYPGRKPVETIEMPEPKWEVVWSLEKRAQNELWFDDHSAVIGHHSIRIGQGRDEWSEALEIEVFKPERKIITLPLENKNFYPMIMDKMGRLYIKVRNRDIGETIIERCAINLDKETLSCTSVLELTLTESRPMDGFDVLSDNETILYTRNRDACVYIKRPKGQESECFTAIEYETGSHISISPDERWAVFMIHGAVRLEDSYLYDRDYLYAVELIKE